MIKHLVATTLLLGTLAVAQNPFEIFSLSQQALAQGDTASYLAHARQAHDMAPFDLWFTINLAKGYAMNGQKTKCIEMLEDLAVIGFDYNVRNDEGFRKIRNHSLLKQIEKQAQKNANKAISTIAYTIREKDLIPEGIAYDPRRNIFYISSIFKRKVIALYSDGSVRDVVSEAADGIFSTYGLRVDAARNQLWVLSSLRESGVTVTDGKERGKARVHHYDLESMRLLNIYTPDDTLSHLFNDLAIAANGDVYLTDSKNSSIYRIDVKTNTMVNWYERKEMYFPNGITISPDQHYLFVAHWKGISRISIADTQSVLLTTKLKTTMTGIDGLYFYDNALIAVQNNAGPQSRIMRFDLNKKYDGVLKSTVLESAHPEHNIPTTGVIIRDEFYYIANSQMRSYNADGSIFSSDKLQPTYILKLPLNPAE